MPILCWVSLGVTVFLYNVIWMLNMGWENQYLNRPLPFSTALTAENEILHLTNRSDIIHIPGSMLVHEKSLCSRDLSSYCDTCSCTSSNIHTVLSCPSHWGFSSLVAALFTLISHFLFALLCSDTSLGLHGPSSRKLHCSGVPTCTYIHRDVHTCVRGWAAQGHEAGGLSTG